AAHSRIRSGCGQSRALDVSAESELFKAVVEGTAEFDALLASLRRRGEADLARVEPAVREILGAVKKEGDRALARLVERFEERRPTRFFVRDYGGAAALAGLRTEVRAALELAAERIRRYHERQREGLFGFEYEERGVRLGSRVLPLAR